MLSIGIVGLPNVGKSTLFNALTKNNVLAANYPFATIEPNTGVVPVPDTRLEILAKISKSQEVVPAVVKFVDIAGLVAGAHKGEGMGNEFLSNIRETSAIAQIVRVFADDDVQHVHNKLDPKHDIEVINGELILADLQTIDNHLPKLAKLAKSDKLAAKQMAEIEKLQQKLNDEVLAINAGIDLELIKHLNLLTAKPFIYVFNIDEKDINNIAKQEELAALAPAESVFVSAKIEAELSQIEEAGDLMAEYGLEETGLERLSEVGYSTLGLQSFLTTGEKETRAWTIRKGTTAPEAAGVIHTDFEKGFIKAEVVSYPKIVEAGSWLEARNNGWVRTEGREYIMQPDDVVEFKINKTTT